MAERMHTAARGRVAACALALLLLLAACARPDIQTLQMDASLAYAYLPEEEQAVYRVEVHARDATNKPVNRLQVRADVLDAHGQTVASLPCKRVFRDPGSYYSAPFTPTAEAAGPWQVKVTGASGSSAIEQVWAFQVDEPASPAEQSSEPPAAEAAVLPEETSFEQISHVSPVGGNEHRTSSTTAIAAWQAQQTNRALLFAMLVGVGAVITFVGIWRTTHSLDPIRARLREYGLDGSSAFTTSDAPATGFQQMPRLKRLMNGLGLGPHLADQLAQADVPLTATEFLLLSITLALLGGLVGVWRLGFPLGLLAAVLGYLPMLYLNIARGRRRHAFTNQLPDAITLLVGALRAGYGLTQSLQVLVDQLPAPASKEFARVVNVVSLGMPMQQALNDLAERIQTDDVGLMVTAISVQYQVGGNLAETLDTIAETIRSRIRIQRQIQALTAEERLTGYILAALPTVLGVILFTMNPDYMSGLFAPGLPRLMCIAALLLQFIGYLIIRRIIAIEV